MRCSVFFIILVIIILIMLVNVNNGFSQNHSNSGSATLRIEVKVIDNIPPEIHNCPQDITKYIKPNQNSFAYSWTEPTATDNDRVVSFASNHQPGYSFPVGTTIVTYTAMDNAENIVTCSFYVIVIRDNVAPVILNCPSDIIAYTGENATQCSAVVTWTAPTATDNNVDESPSITSNYTSGHSFPVGTTTVTYTATDWAGNTSTCSFNVTVKDNTSPGITVSVSPAILWPPNHKLTTITATIRTKDNCSSGSSINYVLESITSNEPDNGLGDGDTENDIQEANYNTADKTFKLRAERSGKGNGRIYTITYKATDSDGNTNTTTATVEVPHNR